MSNFTFLPPAFKDLAESARKAEGQIMGDPRAACFHARFALETAVRWLYRHDDGTRASDPDEITRLDAVALPLLQGLPPVWSPDARVLVLGSLPGARSLAEQRYYAHPRNQFWLLLGTSIGIDLAALPYADRLQAISAAGIALWEGLRQLGGLPVR